MSRARTPWGWLPVALILVAIVSDARASVPGNHGEWRFESVTADLSWRPLEGRRSDLRHSSIYSIVQGRTGFLWIGAENGLYRYDGYGFQHFPPGADEADSPNERDISFLYEDSTGLIWIGTWGGGLDRFDPAGGTFARFPSGLERSGALADDRIQVVFEDSRSVIWVGTFSGGLARIDREAEGLVLYRHDPDDVASLSHDRVWSIAEDRTGRLWIATSGGLSIFDPDSRRFTTLRHDPERPESLCHDQVREVYLDRRGIMWVGTQQGLDRHEPGREGFAHVLDGATVSVVFEDSRANLWVGARDGLGLLDRSSGTVQRFRHDPSSPASLADNDVRALYEDHSQILWIGTREGGLSKLDLKPRKFRHITHHPGDPAGLGGKIVRSLAEDASGRLWIGTDGGLDRQDGASQRFRHVRADPEDPRSLPGSDVHLLHTDSSKRLWVGVWHRGLSRWLGEAEGFETFRHDADDPTSLPSDVVTAMADAPAGGLWIGTDHGLARFDPERGTTRIFRHDGADPESLSANLVWSLLVDTAGVLWVGTDNGGLNRYEAALGRFERFRYDARDPTTLSHDRVFAIHQQDSGRIWIATADGLNELRPEGGFRRYQEAEGLPGSAVLAILSDSGNRLWLSTHRGISRFDPATGKFRNYTVGDGVQGSQFLPGVALARADGRLLFGGNNGFNSFHPSQVLDNPHAPPVVLTGFRRFNEPLEVRAGSAAFRSIELEHTDNFFTFEFAALDFTRPLENRYRYRLDDFDRGWVDSGSRNFATYTNVEPGDYVFHLQGSNSDGVWNPGETTVRLRVGPPWWHAPWVRASAALLLIGLSVTIYRWQIGRHTRRENELRRRVEASHTELRRSEARYRKLFERNLAGVVRATVEGRILDCNDAFARIFGYGSRKECRRHHRLTFGQDEGSGAMLEQLREQGSYESSARAGDGSSVTLLWNANLVMDETSEGLVIEGTVIDISERRRMEERLRREQKLESLEVLAGGIAHDFNNLLVGILGNTELARMELEPASPVREHLGEIEQAAHRAATLSKKMLAYSGKGRFVARYLDLSAAVEEALALIHVPAEVTVERRFNADLPSVKADAAQIHQLLSNLIANAAEAIGEGTQGKIFLTTGARHCDREYLARTFIDGDLEEGLYAFVEVRDDGPGIDPEAQAKIFDPFFTTKFPGRGLGLPVVLGIVRGHKGALEFSSQAGHGTTVRVLFPASDEAVTAPIPFARVDRTWKGSGKVLVIDDEAVVRKISEQMLEILGFEVLTAEDGDEGVEVFHRHADEIVLVVLDLTMPRMSGDKTFHEIRRVRADARVLLASGYEKQRATERFEGLAGFIQKPYQLATLREKVRRAIEGRV